MILELHNIEKSFGDKKVLCGVSMRAEGGKAFGLLGRNGAGKTTTIRILMDVFPADGGRILMDGKPIDYRRFSWAICQKNVACTPRSWSLISWCTLRSLRA